MINCLHYQQQMIEYIENQLPRDVQREMLEHIKHCAVCAHEYRRLKKLYKVMDEDEVTLPSGEFFDKVKSASRQRVVQQTRETLTRWARVIVPALAISAIVLVVFSRRNDVVEINIPVTNLIEDEEIAGIAFAGIVNEEVFDEIMNMEDCLVFDNDDEIEEMTIEEKNEFIDSLYHRYTLDT